MTTCIAIDGKLEGESARISVLDRGFLYGDSVYEVLRTYRGSPWLLTEHLQRLAQSAQRLAIDLPVSTDVLRQEVQCVLEQVGEQESYIRLIVTRGSGPINLDPGLAVDPCRIIIVTELRPLAPQLYLEGVRLHIAGVDTRSASALARGAKSGNYLPNILALGAARQAGAHEALLVDEQGRVAEGASSNIFVVIDGQLKTPPLSAGILEGITRRKVIDLASSQCLAVAECPLELSELFRAEEVFLTSTLREILPVTELDDRAIRDGRPGPITSRLHQAYRELIGAA
ncbi:MAG: aminotransferase class IV [Deltaproteobacteria bacterium]|nr:aminotransferase class IV [Deltaproteobacteria bacterium]